MRDDRFVKIAKALADPTRHRMLHEIRAAGEMTCSDVCACFARSQPTISHHIKTLEAAGLISVRREGAFHVLRVEEATVAAFASDLAGGAAGGAAGGVVGRASAEGAAPRAARSSTTRSSRPRNPVR